MFHDDIVLLRLDLTMIQPLSLLFNCCFGKFYACIDLLSDHLFDDYQLAEMKNSFRILHLTCSVQFVAYMNLLC